MAKYTLYYWRAIDAKGELQQGEILCTSRQQVITQLATYNYTLLFCKIKKIYFKHQWTGVEKIMLIRQLATLLKAGTNLADSLHMLAEDHPDAGWRALLYDLHTHISQGMPFSTALNRWPVVFPALYPALIHIGELTGQLDECCMRLAQQQERQFLLQKKVTKALRYPLFILLVAAAVTTGMLLFVLPEFEIIYRSFNAPLPVFTAGVMALSTWLQKVMPFLLFILPVLGWLYQRQRTRSGRWQKFEQRLLLRLPLISQLWRGSQLSQIFAVLTLTQQAGLTLLHSLQAVEKTLNSVLWRQALVQLQTQVSGGQALHQAISQHSLFTPLCYRLIKAGEETGTLDILLEKLAQWHGEKTQELADTLAASLEPVMMVVIGGIVGSLVVAMYLPVFGLGNALG